jgi:hypothetical protein
MSKLVDKCQEIYPNCDERFVKTKIESMRSSFRREIRKVLQSKNKTGSAGDDVYEPNLRYYDLLLFTCDQEREMKGASSIRKRAPLLPPEPEEDIDVDGDVTEIQYDNVSD